MVDHKLYTHKEKINVSSCPKSLISAVKSINYVKGTQFRSPLHQHSKKKVNQAMK